MAEIEIKQMPGFKKAYKKLHGLEKQHVNEAIVKVCTEPTCGKQKKGDLAGVYVYKFKIKTKQILLAYEWDPNTRILIAIGVHENFYRDLKT